jgi:hypothetical protein
MLQTCSAAATLSRLPIPNRFRNGRLRRFVPSHDRNRTLHRDLEAVENLLHDGSLLAAVEGVAPLE